MSALRLKKEKKENNANHSSSETMAPRPQSWYDIKKKKKVKIPQGQFYIFILHCRQKESGFPMLGPLFLNMKQRCFP